MLGSGTPDSARTRHRSVRPETTRSQGGGDHLSTSHRIVTSRRRRSPSEQKRKLTAGEIYNVDTLVQCGCAMEKESVPSLRLQTERPDVNTRHALDVSPKGQLTLLGAPDRRDLMTEGDRRKHLADDVDGVIEPVNVLEGERRRRTHHSPGEQEDSLFSQGDSRVSVEAVWGSSSTGLRSESYPLQLPGRPAARRKGVEREGRAEAITMRYMLGGEEAADGRKIEETTIRCIEAGAGAAAARRRRFRRGNACARLAAWAQPPGDTAFHPLPSSSPMERKFEKRRGVEASPCLSLGGKAETRNYHLHAQKPLLPTGPGKDSLTVDMQSGEEEDTHAMGITASLIFLDPRTHRLRKRQATLKLTPSATQGGVPDADGVQLTKTFRPGAPRAADHLPLLTDEKSLETTAKLFEAFERCHPDAAGWLLTNDLRWTLPRDQRVQEIFGLTRKLHSQSGRDGREETGKQRRTQGNDKAQQQDTNATCSSWTNRADALAWAKELLRNRDEPVQFTRTSQIKYEAMLDKLRRVESSLINNDRAVDALKISFDIFCRAFWPFVSGIPADAAAYGGAAADTAALPIALEKHNPYALTPMQMLVRDALLGVRLSQYEVRLPDYVECGHLPLMECPDMTLAETQGTLQMQPDERRQLLEQFSKREEASFFEKTYSHVLKVESQLAEYELLKKALGRHSRMHFLSLPAEDLKKKISSARLSSINE